MFTAHLIAGLVLALASCVSFLSQEASAQQANAKQEAKHSDGSDVGISILGTIVDKQNQDNVALIKELKDGSVKAVKRGHNLSVGRYVIAKITAEYLVLVREGDKNFHYVYKDKFGGDMMKGNQGGQPGQGLADQQVYSEKGLERKRNGTQTDIKMTSSFRDKIVTEDLSQILMQASAIPHIENGNIVGFRLLQIDEGSIFSKAGLKDEDVVTAINGTQLSSAAGAISLLRSLKGANQLDVDLLRSGTKESISIQVN